MVKEYSLLTLISKHLFHTNEQIYKWMGNIVSNKLNVTVTHENLLSAQIPIPPTSLFIQDGFQWLSDVFAIEKI